MFTKKSSASALARHKPVRPSKLPKDYGWILYLLVISLLLLAGFFISLEKLYKPGDEVGYNLGLVGGLMMATILLYPLRKRMGFMRNWVLLPKWFQWHMTFGVLGPAIIVFHSAFQVYIPFVHPRGSINAAVAMLSMLLVSGSGIFGRFFYTKIHMGLYGRQVSHNQMQENLDGTPDVQSIFNYAPSIQQQLVEFKNFAAKSSRVGQVKNWKVLTLGLRAKLLSRHLVRELEDIMYGDANAKQWNDVQMKRLDEMFYQNVEFIESYILAVRDLAQFSTYEKLFSLWYIFHVPFVYMLVFSGIWHVIAINMY